MIQMWKKKKEIECFIILTGLKRHTLPTFIWLKACKTGISIVELVHGLHFQHYLSRGHEWLCVFLWMSVYMYLCGYVYCMFYLYFSLTEYEFYISIYVNSTGLILVGPLSIKGFHENLAHLKKCHQDWEWNIISNKWP